VLPAPGVCGAAGGSGVTGKWRVLCMAFHSLCVDGSTLPLAERTSPLAERTLHIPLSSVSFPNLRLSFVTGTAVPVLHIEPFSQITS
jgi:hypothetical protein